MYKLFVEKSGNGYYLKSRLVHDGEKVLERILINLFPWIYIEFAMVLNSISVIF